MDVLGLYVLMRLSSQAYLYKESSPALGISGHTVATYLRRIYKKLHVKSCAQATALDEQMKPQAGPQVSRTKRGKSTANSRSSNFPVVFTK